MSSLKNRLEKIALSMQPKKNDYIFKVDCAGIGIEPLGYRDEKTGILYGVDDDLSHLEGYNVLFAEYPEGLGIGF
jgi:hypothetical protein